MFYRQDLQINKLELMQSTDRCEGAVARLPEWELVEENGQIAGLQE